MEKNTNCAEIWALTQILPTYEKVKQAVKTADELDQKIKLYRLYCLVLHDALFSIRTWITYLQPEDAPGMETIHDTLENLINDAKQIKISKQKTNNK